MSAYAYLIEYWGILGARIVLQLPYWSLLVKQQCIHFCFFAFNNIGFSYSHEVENLVILNQF